MLKYFFTWVPMACIAIADGVLRQAWYGRYLGELRTHRLSTLIGALPLAVYIWVRLLQDYNILAGRVWALLLIWVAVAPYLCLSAIGGKK